MSTLEKSSEERLQQTIDKFWETIPPVWNYVRGNIRAIVSEQFDISVDQFHILRHIRKGYSSVSDLAGARQISRPAVSQALDLLVEKGLVTRIPSRADRRCVRLELTSAGNELLNTIFKKNRVWLAEKMAGLTAAENELIVCALDLLKQTLEEEPILSVGKQSL
jgi:DNA-binding MarR family transcriptional regulator